MTYSTVFHVDLFDSARLGLALVNVENYLNALPDTAFETVVLANGPAVQLFKAEACPYTEQVAALQKRGTSFRLCANALAAFDIAHTSIVPGCSVVPGGIVELVNLQQKGFSYIKP